MCRAAQATPRPWKQYADMIWAPDAKSIIAAVSEPRPEGETLVRYHELHAGSKQLEEAYENARLIVRAVNVHDDLVDALERMIKAHEALMPGLAHIAVADYAEQNDAPIAARRALAKARDKGEGQ